MTSINKPGNVQNSTIYDNNYTTSFSSDNIISNLYTDGIATFSNGTVIDLVSPVNPQDAVSKEFVFTSSNPGGPANSVQFNNGGGFAGSSDLLYDNGLNTLSINGDTNVGSIVISGGNLTGLNDPVSNQQIATKKYVDSFSNSGIFSYIQSDSPVTYTGAQMLNGSIARNIFTGPTNIGLIISDTTASAQDLFDATGGGAVIGSTFKWKLVNNEPLSFPSTQEIRDRFVLFINPGTGVTFNPISTSLVPTFQIPRGYTLDTNIIFTSITPPAVTININILFAGYLTVYSFPGQIQSPVVVNLSTPYISYNSVCIGDNLLYNVDDSSISTLNYTYTNADIDNSFIYRTQVGVSNDKFGSDLSLQYQIFTIQNNGTGQINITGLTSLWDIIPATISIPTLTQSRISLTSKNIIDVYTPGDNYNLGLFPTSGGTGSGMIVSVGNLITTSTVINIGSGYLINGLTTTTGGSGTGLQVIISTDNGTINYIQNIVGFLSGYLPGDILTINGGDNNAQIQLNSINTIDSLSISTLGNNLYSEGDIITIINGSSNNGQFTLPKLFKVFSLGNTSL